MKLLSLILFTILFTFSRGDNYLTILPKGNGCGSDNYGVGYYLPMGTCVSVNDWNIQITQPNNTHIQISYLGPNCSNENQLVQAYSLNECQSFQFLDSPYGAIDSIFTVSDSIPADSVVYDYYYYSYYCSGPTYSIFYTSGYSNSFSKYACVDKKAEVFVCTGTGNCNEINVDGCFNGKGLELPYKVYCN